MVQLTHDEQELEYFGYMASKPGAAFFITAFGGVALVGLYVTYKYPKAKYMWILPFSAIIECIGYANTTSAVNLGKNIVLGGLAFQLIFFTIFTFMMVYAAFGAAFRMYDRSVPIFLACCAYCIFPFGRITPEDILIGTEHHVISSDKNSREVSPTSSVDLEMNNAVGGGNK
eukprot:gene39355-48630_t